MNGHVEVTLTHGVLTVVVRGDQDALEHVKEAADRAAYSPEHIEPFVALKDDGDTTGPLFMLKFDRKDGE